jgi:retron-type reverse transcriptase
MIEKVLNRKNLYKAYRKVVQNKGSAGVDGMVVSDLFSYMENNRDRIATSILNHTYVPKPIEGRTKRELRALLGGGRKKTER